jgi:hypothetical protein
MPPEIHGVILRLGCYEKFMDIETLKPWCWASAHHRVNQQGRLLPKA